MFNATFNITVSNEVGCIDSTEVAIRVDKPRRIYIPNAFSPNSDGINDRFFIAGRGYGLIRRFRIFDRWGDLVFESTGGLINDPVKGWDGTFQNEKMNDGLFIWTAEIEFLDGLTQAFSGEVLLLR